MPGKGHSPEQVLNKLRQAEIAVAGGKSVGQAVREIGVTDALITGGDASTGDSTSTRQDGSRDSNRRTHG